MSEFLNKVSRAFEDYEYKCAVVAQRAREREQVKHKVKEFRENYPKVQEAWQSVKHREERSLPTR